VGLRLRGCTALVTGASSGIGAATADALAAAGARLVLTGRDTTRLDAVARRTGGRSLPADLTDPAELAQVCDAAREVDLLVASAGQGWAGEVTAMTASQVAGLVALNLTAPLQLTRAALPHMRRRRRGHLVFVSSIAAVGVGQEAVYSATKAGLRAFAAAVRHEAAADGIGVSTLLPAAVQTPFFDRRGLAYDRRFPRQLDTTVVAAALLRAVERDSPEVFVPRWLTVAARVHGALPEVFHRLAGRFG